MDNNPFDKKPTDAAPKAGDSPVEKKLTPAVEPKKKKGLSVGKIISIFAGLVLVGVVVGTLMYSQSGERFKGAAGTMPGANVPSGNAVDATVLAPEAQLAIDQAVFDGNLLLHTLCIPQDTNNLCDDGELWSWCDGQGPVAEPVQTGPNSYNIEWNYTDARGNCGQIYEYYEEVDFCDMTVSQLQSLSSKQTSFLLSTGDKALLTAGTEAFYAEKCEEVISGSMECVVNTQGTPYSCECPTGEEVNSAGDACEATVVECPAGTVLDEGGINCIDICSNGTVWDDTDSQCYCPDGEYYMGNTCNAIDCSTDDVYQSFIIANILEGGNSIEAQSTGDTAMNILMDYETGYYIDFACGVQCDPLLFEELNTAGDACECVTGYTLDPNTNVCELTLPTCGVDEYYDGAVCDNFGALPLLVKCDTDPLRIEEYLNLNPQIVLDAAEYAAWQSAAQCALPTCAIDQYLDIEVESCVDFSTLSCLEDITGTKLDPDHADRIALELLTASTATPFEPAVDSEEYSNWFNDPVNNCIAASCGDHGYNDPVDPSTCIACGATEELNATVDGCDACGTDEILNATNVCEACGAGLEPNANQSACVSSTLTCTAPDYMNAAGDACSTPAGTDTICTDLTSLKDEMKTFYGSAVEGTEDWTQYDANLNDIISILSNNPGHADLELIDPLDPNYCEGFSDCDLEYDSAVSGFGNLDIDLTLSNVYQDRSAGVLNSCYTYEDICTFSKLTANELSKESSISPLQEAGFREMLITCKDEVPAAATKAGYLQDIVDYIRDLFASNNTSYIAQLFPTAYAAAGDLSIPVMDIIDDVYAVTTTTTSNTSSGGSSSGSAGGRPSGGSGSGSGSTATSSAGHGAATGEECRSLEISAPGAAVGDAPTVTISEDGYLSEMLQVSVDADSGAVADYRYKSLNGTITFNGVGSEYDSAAEVVYMDGGPQAGDSDTITVWARDTGGNGIATCNDSFTVRVEGTPEVEPVVAPAIVMPEIIHTAAEPVVEEPETMAAEIEESAPLVIAATQEVPEQPLTGPGVLIYLVGAGVGSALWNRRKRK